LRSLCGLRRGFVPTRRMSLRGCDSCTKRSSLASRCGRATGSSTGWVNEQHDSSDDNPASRAPFPIAGVASMTILVGTASCTDKSLIESGKLYPKDAISAEERLRYYASEFSMDEGDSSYYAIPTPQTAQLWAERTPRNFVFNVKAFRALTGHQFQAKVLPKDLQMAIGTGHWGWSPMALTQGSFPRCAGEG